MKTRLTAASFGLALAAAVFLFVWPIYAPHATLLQVNGYWAIFPVAFPVVIALLPLVFRNQAVRIIATVVIGGFSFVGSWSIGLFYVPAALTMLLAACGNRPTFRGKVAALGNPLYDAFLRLTTSDLAGVIVSNSLMRFGICLYPWTRRNCFSATSSPEPTHRSR